jgi:hypothetical protein
MWRVGALLLTLCASFGEARLPFWSALGFGKQQQQRKEYTPLVFFTVPRGLFPENDALEASVQEVEKELGVRVERLDILKNPAAEAALAALTSKSPPFLYHRESCQHVHLQPAAGEASSSSSAKPYVDKERVRAWAKGRFLTSPAASRGAKVKPPTVNIQDETAMEQEELLEDMTLTPLQLKGKEAIRERTEARATDKAEES